jgi:hypothetical protein
MLMYFSNKRRKIASGILSVFMGSWLLLLCQTCIASTDNAMKHNETSSEVTNACHVPDDNIDSIEDEHCLGACDCDALTVTVKSDKNSDSKEKIKSILDIVATIASKTTLSNRAPPGYPISSSPERAKLPPFYTYNVLLI